MTTTRTVLTKALIDDVSNYSSGPLDVGDLHELSVVFELQNSTVSGATYGAYLYIFQLGEGGVRFPLISLQIMDHPTPPPNPTYYRTSIGAGLVTDFLAIGGGQQVAFGEKIEVDIGLSTSAPNTLGGPGTVTVSGFIEIVGK